MDQLRKEVRQALRSDPWNLPVYLPAGFAATAKNDLHQLWKNVSGYDSSTHLNVSLFMSTGLQGINKLDLRESRYGNRLHHILGSPSSER